MRTVFIVGVCVIFGLSGCGASEPEMGSAGTYGGPCLSDGSCDEGLKCVYHVCKDE